MKLRLSDALFRHVFSIDNAVNFLLKLAVSCAFATSGYDHLSTTCRIFVIQQLLYLLCSISFITLLRTFSLRLVRTSAKTCLYYIGTIPSGSSIRLSEMLQTRNCSVSSCRTDYPDVQSIPQLLSASSRSSSVHVRLKYLILLGLFFLCVHNYHLFRMPEKLSFSFLPVLPFPSDYSMPDVTLYRFSLFFLDRSTLNLFLFILIGVLFYHRVKRYTVPRTELLNQNSLRKSVQYVSTTPASSSVYSPAHTASSSHNTPDHLAVTCECFATLNTVDGDFDPEQHRIHDPDDSDKRLLEQLALGHLKTRDLETVASTPNKAVELRRLDLCRLLSNPHALDRLPFRDYDYRFVCGQCCEEVIGYVPIPIGKVGPLLLDGRSHYLPLATTEGCLVASTNRGCRALFLAGGVKSVVFRDQMTRAPVVWFPSVMQLVECIAWIESDEGFQQLKTVFDRTSAHVSLISVFPNPSGHYLHIRFAARTGDAMGMNMVSKATNSALRELSQHFPTMQVLSLSGNMCTDKKPASINTILGRGKSVIAEANLSATVVSQVLHTTATRLTRLAHAKNWTGSAMAGCPGMSGSNAHAANIVAGIFAATGQDLAQIVDASACLTQFEVGQDDSLIASVTMPCMEVGTIGGGTRLPAQRACLDLMNLSVDRPTEHLARLIAGAVLAGELSLMAALDTDDLVSAHLRLNRAPPLSACSESSLLGDLSLPRDVVHATIVKSDASGRLDPPHPIM